MNYAKSHEVTELLRLFRETVLKCGGDTKNIDDALSLAEAKELKYLYDTPDI